ncbi:MAG: hypothetical protein HY822_07625 [Acidobacteria bacterium]|nr:hypothetical protein [Acidobacteriota bacterium]
MIESLSHAVLILALAGAVPARAETYRHTEGGVSIWIPDHWNADLEDDSVSGFSEDGDAAVELVSLRGAADQDAAGRLCQARLARAVREFEETEARRETSINGLRGFRFAGQGVYRGGTRSLQVIVLKSPRQFLMFLWSADRATARRWDTIRDRIAGSIQTIT